MRTRICIFCMCCIKQKERLLGDKDLTRKTRVRFPKDKEENFPSHDVIGP